jgi:hypothetical protein
LIEKSQRQPGLDRHELQRVEVGNWYGHGH